MLHSIVKDRARELDTASTDVFDVVIVGGGITGASLFHTLREKGFRTLLLDKSDFASGTSQASAMMLWGGLIYLRSLDLTTVYHLSAAREQLLRQVKDIVHPRTHRYIIPSRRWRDRMAVAFALHLYWLMGAFNRSRPRLVNEPLAMPAVKEMARSSCFQYEEAYLPDSDARFVLQWILRSQSADCPALNYCGLQTGGWDRSARLWSLEIEDHILQRHATIQTRVVVNAAGVWADRVNRLCQIETPYTHVMSKGVFIGIRRHAGHQIPLILGGERDRSRDCFTLIPWGPISLWGPTETVVSNPQEGFSVTAQDVGILLEQYNRSFIRPVDAREDIVSIRCGVRGLVVPRFARVGKNSTVLSRKYVVHRDASLPWVSIYGGKLTSCMDIARRASAAVEGCISASGLASEDPSSRPALSLDSFPGLTENIPSARSTALEKCWTLEDYLRRRTNISQWVPRGGLGARNENAEYLERIGSEFLADPRLAVRSYRHKIENTFDRVLADSASNLTGAPVPSPAHVEVL